MKMKKKHIILYTLLVAISGLALFFLLRSGSIKTELEHTKTAQEKLEKRLLGFHQLLGIDSTLVKGNYNQALKAYNAILKSTEGNDSIGTSLRIDLAQKLIQLRVRATKEDTITQEDLDSLKMEAKTTQEEINAYDAVSFELEKAKVQLGRMRRQLKERSFGEYLSFKSKKGSQMHYVGRVVNNEANGFGVALLDTGSRYEGEWRNNQRHGEGSFYWPDGEYYIGNYSDDQRNGEGTYYWPNGEKYIGQWKNDKRNGQGVFYGSDGREVTRGIWKNDKLETPEKKEKK